MKPSQKNLFEIAKSQQGFFTAAQAVKAGYQTVLHPYHVKNENWIKEYRGIYRLAHFVYSSQSQLVVTSLWSMNLKGKVEGVFSHETALVIYDVSDANPHQLHMTVPKHFRRHSKPPAPVVFYKNKLLKKDIRDLNGFKVTTPFRTICDLIDQNETEEGIIIQAIEQLYKQGLLSFNEIKRIKLKNKNAIIKNFLQSYHYGNKKVQNL